MRDILNSELRKYGQSCMNCQHLEREYDLDEAGAEKWVCGRFQAYGNREDFPFTIKMRCFEPCFWYTTFAPGWNATDRVLEDAMARFAAYLNSKHLSDRAAVTG